MRNSYRVRFNVKKHVIIPVSKATNSLSIYDRLFVICFLATEKQKNRMLLCVFFTLFMQSNTYY